MHSSSARTRLPPPPPPEPGECCNRDCNPCVKDIHEQSLRRNRSALRWLEAAETAVDGPPCTIAIEVVRDGNHDGNNRGAHGLAASNALDTTELVSAEVLTAAGLAQGRDVRRVLLTELQLPARLHGTYAPGDYVAIRPPNRSAMVEDILGRLLLDGGQAIRVVASAFANAEDHLLVSEDSDAEEGQAMDHHHYLIGEPPFTVADAFMCVLPYLPLLPCFS